jgi:hypothetical protein
MTTQKKILIIPDLHVPHHHRPSWNLVLKVAAAVKFDIVVTMGDFLDLASMSGHKKRQPIRTPSLKEEIRAGNRELDRLDFCGIPEKYFIEGNHETRYTRFIADNMQLDGMNTIPEALRLSERGWQWVPYWHELKLGKVYFTHDYGQAGMNAARGARTKVGGNVVIGHCHTMNYDVLGSVKGSHVAACFGWLGDSKHTLEYISKGAARHSWTLGFGVGVMLSSGDIHFQPVPIINGRAMVFGEIFSA